MVGPVSIAGRMVGEGFPAYVIAEAGVNHNGDIRLAHELVVEAAKAGVDAIKFQSFHADELVGKQVTKAKYQIANTGTSESQYQMLKSLELSAEDHGQIQRKCDELGITYLCTPYDYSSLTMLVKMGVAAIKVASTDTTNIPFLEQIGGYDLPVILSTGMSTLGEVNLAVEALKAGGNVDKLILLHCVSQYPTPLDECNLLAIKTLRNSFKCPVGYSDHTAGVEASLWAIATGACILEKHFTLDREMEGPDHKSSLEPAEMALLVANVRQVERSLGDGLKRVMPSESENKPIMQKSLAARADIQKGDFFTEDNVTVMRPAAGLHPLWLNRVIGKRAKVDIPSGHSIGMESVVW